MTPKRLKLFALVLILASRVAVAAEPTPARVYEQARRVYYSLKSSRQKQRFRHHWLKAISSFTAVASAYPDSLQAALSLYTAGELWNDLQRISRRRTDYEQAVAAYGRVAREHPGSSLADDALWQMAQLQLRVRGDRAAAAKALERLLARYPSGDMVRRARAEWPKVASALPKARAGADDSIPRPLVGRREEKETRPVVTAVEHWSNDVYSRVVVYLSAAAEARDGGQVGDAVTPQIVVDIAGAGLDPALASGRAVDDELLSGVRLEDAEGGVRLSLVLKRAAQHRLMVLESPYRLVIDAFTSEPDGPAALLARARRVVIDPGHGGRDSGAVSPRGAREKDIVLAIAKEAEALLAQRGVDVVLTRKDDRFVTLEERTAIANRAAADLFVSIHANAHAGAGARGVETYYLDTTDDAFALKLAARENAIQQEQVSDVQLVLADLATKLNTRESRALAVELQRELVTRLRPHNPRVRDLGVKASLFYVLLGARMPAVLVETSFLSNPDEARLLGSAAYRKAAAEAIARAVGKRLTAAPVLLAKP